MARGFRQETTMSLRWIARRLNMETAGALANLLRRDENQYMKTKFQNLLSALALLAMLDSPWSIALA
jgi:hypothetical protein